MDEFGWPILYGLARSVYTRIARRALEEKGVDYTLEEVEIFGTAGVPKQHLERHPFGRIPTFAQGAFHLYETNPWLAIPLADYEGFRWTVVRVSGCRPGDRRALGRCAIR